MYIRLLQEADAQQYQEFRLKSLTTNPEAFGSTFEREVKFSQAAVAARIQPTTDKFVLGAFDDKDALGGTVTFMRESGPKTIHKGNVYGMYIAPEMRGNGLGRSLMLQLISKAREHEGLEQINLTVVSDNDSAKKLYKSLGFEVYGIEQNALKFNGHYLNEDLMVLKL
ncbi:GNAT family N-acetyltransferase [Paenibacillus lutrae]|uniref:GNAT family N-acetyltransferase n=1 Tax=Paenibacillus lutrae TaxID=2078573 RepID=A0A7X3JXV9_9BACL|nr:GNAT family protein [Paenibacillus lutrae]MVO98416.1 GNAT family N-acetyltransferase [Paenibacillus lutrae]